MYKIFVAVRIPVGKSSTFKLGYERLWVKRRQDLRKVQNTITKAGAGREQLGESR